MRKYHFLEFRPGVDWRHVNPVLLQRLNRLGADKNEIITITSGARTRQNNTGARGSHHVPENNPSGIGEAVDAYIGRRPLASVVRERVLKRYGLYSGNRPGFYQGRPDPEHIETLERRTGQQGSVPSGGAGVTSGATTEPPGGTPASPPQAEIPEVAPTPTTPEEPVPPVIGYPGETPPGPFESLTTEDAWRTLAEMPFSSPETQMWAARLRQGQGQ